MAGWGGAGISLRSEGWIGNLGIFFLSEGFGASYVCDGKVWCGAHGFMKRRATLLYIPYFLRFLYFFTSFLRTHLFNYHAALVVPSFHTH